MFVLTKVAIPDVFLIFFLTLGPLKALGPFAQVTRGPIRPFVAPWPGGPLPSPPPSWLQ